MEIKTIDFRDIIYKIESGKILLPDFQREFVWREEEQQKKIVASVLAKMPIGSILLLRSNPDEYACKYIGCQKKVDTQGMSGEVEFLLDGQQRMTVLTNVFSNVVHEKCDKVTDLISPSLKRRFFLRIPKWSSCREEKDLFGVHNLTFPISDSGEPDFLSGDILSFVECIGFLNRDKKPYNPQEKLSTELDDFCLTYKEGYLIPLFLLTPSGKGKREQMELRYEIITSGIANKIRNEIENHFSTCVGGGEKSSFIDEIFEDETVRERVKQDYSLFQKKMDEKETLWRRGLVNYIGSCIQNVSMNTIEVSADKRARAIDIYENLNRGGVSLDTFDLVMARVAKVSKENFYQRIVSYIKAEKSYNIEVLPENIVAEIEEKIRNRTYNATMNTGCYSVEKNEITGKYIDVFLDVLSLYCHNTDFDPEGFKVDDIKKNKILELSPEQIDCNSEAVCIAIDRAMFFFQSRCGIRNIVEINYSLTLVVVSVIFLRQEWFEDKYVHEKLEAWYWASLFSGEYDKDQNTKMASHLKLIVRMMQKPREKKKTDWILNLKDEVLEGQNFSDKDFLLMEKAEEDRYPKVVLRNFMCQYLLAETYVDMFDPQKRISVYSKEADELETHHIIPLGTVKKVGESTTKLRNNHKHICNSPLNFVYITKTANKEISDEPLNSYVGKICEEAKAVLGITGYINVMEDVSEIKDILSARYEHLKGRIKNRIMLLMNK